MNDLLTPEWILKERLALELQSSQEEARRQKARADRLMVELNRPGFTADFLDALRLCAMDVSAIGDGLSGSFDKIHDNLYRAQVVRQGAAIGYVDIHLDIPSQIRCVSNERRQWVYLLRPNPTEDRIGAVPPNEVIPISAKQLAHTLFQAMVQDVNRPISRFEEW